MYRTSRRLRLLTAVSLFLVASCGHLLWVGAYAESVPFWDQWDAEGAFLLKPWCEQTLQAKQLFAAHNEHRVFHTRLLTLLTFEANGRQWDNLAEAATASLVYALSFALLFHVLTASFGARARALAFIGFATLSFLPFAWENTLVGFGSQYSFLSIFAVLTIVTAVRTTTPRTLLLGTSAIAVLGLFTMGSGIVAAVVAAGLLCARRHLAEIDTRTTLVGVALLFVVAAFGASITPKVDAHAIYRADTIEAFSRALITTTSWPFAGRAAWTASLLFWWPTLFALYRLAVRADVRDELNALGLCAWALCQCAAIAYARGRSLTLVPFRYTDTLAVAVVANACLGLHHMTRLARRPARWAVAPLCSAQLGLLAFSFAQRFESDAAAMRERAQLSAIQAERTRRFLRGDASALSAPLLHIPYPDGARLAQLLTDPTLRAILPSDLLPSRPRRATAALSTLATQLQRRVRAHLSP